MIQSRRLLSASENGDPSPLDSDFDPESLTVQYKDEFVLVDEAHTPRFLKSPFILTGYRVHFSWRLCLRSLFHVHNETGNVWTHLLGAIAFVVLLSRTMMDVRSVWAQTDSANSVSAVDCAVLVAFFLCATACLGFSTVYHLCGCHNEATHHSLYRCDLLGICLLVWGSYVSGLYVGFRCFPQYRLLYIALITGMVAASVALNNVQRCQSRRFHALRVAVLVGLVAFSVVPTLHWVHVTRWAIGV